MCYLATKHTPPTHRSEPPHAKHRHEGGPPNALHTRAPTRHPARGSAAPATPESKLAQRRALGIRRRRHDGSRPSDQSPPAPAHPNQRTTAGHQHTTRPTSAPRVPLEITRAPVDVCARASRELQPHGHFEMSNGCATPRRDPPECDHSPIGCGPAIGLAHGAITEPLPTRSAFSQTHTDRTPHHVVDANPSPLTGVDW